jgi:hypothetical protein
MFGWSRSRRSGAQDLLDMLAAFYWPSCQPPNKQLQRTVICRRGCGAFASFHCAHAQRWTRGHAAAQLRR